MTAGLPPGAAAWARRATSVEVAGTRVSVVDTGDGPGIPVLALHGFPTSGHDWSPILDALAARHRVVVPDLPGFGCSAKPDRPYTIEGHADAVEGVAEAAGLERFALLTHDLGDTVGGELLARIGDGTARREWDVAARVMLNGSIYMDLVSLSVGQQMLLAMPDERAPEGTLDAATVALALRGTLAPGTGVPDAVLEEAASLVGVDGGISLMPRLARYIEQRRTTEWRYTGALEEHPSPVTVIWGAEDPIARVAMADRFCERRPDAARHLLPGVGHYPTWEAPDRVARLVLEALEAAGT